MQGSVPPLLQSAGQSTFGGLATLDRNLRVRSTAVHVTGPPVALMLGPSAGKLSGARRSARAIAVAMFGLERADTLWPN